MVQRHAPSVLKTRLFTRAVLRVLSNSLFSAPPLWKNGFERIIEFYDNLIVRSPESQAAFLKITLTRRSRLFCLTTGELSNSTKKKCDNDRSINIFQRYERLMSDNRHVYTHFVTHIGNNRHVVNLDGIS